MKSTPSFLIQIQKDDTRILTHVSSMHFVEPPRVASINVKSTTNSTITIEWPFLQCDGYMLMWNCLSPNKISHMTFKLSQIVYSNTSTVANLDPGSSCTVNITAYILNFDDVIMYGSTFTEILSNTTDEEGIFK